MGYFKNTFGEGARNIRRSGIGKFTGSSIANISLIGDKIIIAKLENLRRKFTPDIQREIQRRSLVPIQEQMISNISSDTTKKTGNLINSINIDQDKKLSFSGYIVMRVGRRIKRGDSRGMGYHAHFIEYGTSRGVIGTRSFNRAIQSKSDEALRIFEREYSDIIERTLS